MDMWYVAPWLHEHFDMWISTHEFSLCYKVVAAQLQCYSSKEDFNKLSTANNPVQVFCSFAFSSLRQKTWAKISL